VITHEVRRARGAGLSLAVHDFRDATREPSGLTVMLVHGYMDAGATWDRVAAPLARAGHVVLAPDLRGFGASERVGAGGYYHFPDYAADLAALVAELAPRRLALVGHSMGGTAACVFAGALPHAMERLVVIEGLGPPPMPPSLVVDRTRAWLHALGGDAREEKPLAGLDDAVRRLAFNHPRVPRELLRTLAAKLTRTNDRGELVWCYDPLHRTTSPTPFSADGFMSLLREVRCPVLFVDGGPAGFHPPDEPERLACFADLHHETFPEAGHMVHWTAPDRLADALLRFFDAPLRGQTGGKPESA